jgi:Fur family peroxide stress response transcriptional regulator
MNIRQEFPNISLGTVYRNLSLLADIGEIVKISTGDGGDRFDSKTHSHYHFICTECKAVIDLELRNLDHINELAAVNFGGQIKGHTAHFYGLCEDCLKKH